MKKKTQAKRTGMTGMPFKTLEVPAEMDWELNGVAAWDTGAIFEKLSELGVDTDEERFRDQFREHGTADLLALVWSAGVPEGHPWYEFLFIATEELRYRLALDLPTPTSIAKRINECSRLLEASPVMLAEVETRIEEFADYLELFEPYRMADMFTEIALESSEDLLDVLRDSMYLYGTDNTGLADRVYRIVCEADSEQSLDLAMVLIHIHLNAGQASDAGGYITDAISRNRQLVEPYVMGMHFAFATEQWGKATEYAVQALQRVGAQPAWDELYDNITSDLQHLKLDEELKILSARVRRPAGPVGVTKTVRLGSDEGQEESAGLFEFADDYKEARQEPVRVQHVGRNDPCPCGSGKKYKKCHGN